MRIVESFAECRSLAGDSTGLVPTLGFVHEGHLDLMGRCRRENDLVISSLFVNPLQFNDPADFEAYPRKFDRDADLIEKAGVDVLFAPTLEEMYPVDPVTAVVVRGITDSMEGAHRPGHFEGVATVVTKLLAGIQPDRAYFGKKDAQQLTMVTRMVGDLSLPAEIVACSTVREADGLALSSRNVRLSGEARRLASGLSQGLFAAADLVASGERDGVAIEQAVAAQLDGMSAEYVTLADRASAEPIVQLDRPAFLAAAVEVGGVRLIDNVWLETDGSADRGWRLDEASILYGEEH